MLQRAGRIDDVVTGRAEVHRPACVARLLCEGFRDCHDVMPDFRLDSFDAVATDFGNRLADCRTVSFRNQPQRFLLLSEDCLDLEQRSQVGIGAEDSAHLVAAVAVVEHAGGVHAGAPLASFKPSSHQKPLFPRHKECGCAAEPAPGLDRIAILGAGAAPAGVAGDGARR